MLAVAPEEFGPSLCELCKAIESDAARFKNSGSLKLRAIHPTDRRINRPEFGIIPIWPVITHRWQDPSDAAIVRSLFLHCMMACSQRTLRPRRLSSLPYSSTSPVQTGDVLR